jgi:endonuclease/exonuclease/phosphatase family metal-dependent hydrolase
MRIASFNVESLFQRARALNLPDPAEGSTPLELHAKINQLLTHTVYTDDDKTQILALIHQLGLDPSDDAGEFALLRQNHGHLLVRHPDGTIAITATGRADWIGWVELKMETVNEVATDNTARVMHAINPDILAVVEVESRLTLKDFSDVILPRVGGVPFEHVMLIDGNDLRGIDVGVMTRDGFEIETIVSHVDDDDAHGKIFSRDCPEYAIATPSGQRIVLLVNHLKSKGYGNQTDNNARRRRQAQRVAAIYNDLKGTHPYIAVLGDFNDTPSSNPLAPLLADTDLKDISTSPNFVSDGRPGTFKNGTKGDKIDYILLSPDLFARVTGGGVFRKGVWGGTHGTLFEHFPEITREIEAASDHAAIFADIDL